jgi:hypothetical protein
VRERRGGEEKDKLEEARDKKEKATNMCMREMFDK